MSRPALFLLDEPQPLTRSGRITWVAGLTAYTALALYAALRPPAVLEPVFWVPVTHALVLAIVCAFTAMLMVGQANTSGRRGYVWLVGTYLYVASVLAIFPLFFPGAFREGVPVIGGAQSSVTLFYLWHFGFVIGLGVSVWILGADLRRHRRPDYRIRIWPALLLVGGLLLLIFPLVSAGHDLLPALVEPDGRSSSLVGTLDLVLVVLAAAVVGLAAYYARGGALIQRWLLAVTILLLGEAFVNNLSTTRWSFAWYFNRFFGIIALTALFGALLWLIAKAGRATGQLARRDVLTGGDSRASFTHAMDEELAAARVDGRSVSLLWVDLDGFKSVNDELGHAIGDEVLRTTVQRIQAQVRPGDRVGRLGGDEFGVLVAGGVGGPEVDALAGRILASLRDPIEIEDSTTLVTSSIGIATAPGHAQQFEDLLVRADLAMYAAKHAGGDRAQRFSSDLGEDAVSRAHLRHQLAQAIRATAFALDYQPIIEPRTGAVAGYEALARWQRGAERVPAKSFVEFAERSGQIISIGRCVVTQLEEAVPQLLPLLSEHGFITFNMSVKELADSTLIDRLADGPLSHLCSRLVTEVTESQELLTFAEAWGNLDRLRLRGYRIALDDFGAGFSTFTRLEQLRPAVVKVDQSLVQRAGSGVEGGLAFLHATVAVAQSLGCQVVAEGVQTDEDRRVVEALDVPYAQGLSYGRPVPLATLLSQHGTRDRAATP